MSLAELKEKLRKYKKEDIINFRNMVTIKLRIITDSGQKTADIIMPRIRQENSPALSY